MRPPLVFAWPSALWLLARGAMSVILQISDLGTERPPVAEALLALAEALGPDLVVVSGDVPSARPAEFAAAAAFLARLPDCPRLLVPGNHDLPLFDPVSRLLCPYRGFRRCFGDGRCRGQAARPAGGGGRQHAPLAPSARGDFAGAGRRGEPPPAPGASGGSCGWWWSIIRWTWPPGPTRPTFVRGRGRR
jgi:hypothetical protein